MFYKNGCVRLLGDVRCLQFEKNGFIRFCIGYTGENDVYVNSEDISRIQAVGGVINDDN